MYWKNPLRFEDRQVFSSIVVKVVHSRLLDSWIVISHTPGTNHLVVFQTSLFKHHWILETLWDPIKLINLPKASEHQGLGIRLIVCVAYLSLSLLPPLQAMLFTLCEVSKCRLFKCSLWTLIASRRRKRRLRSKLNRVWLKGISLS